MSTRTQYAYNARKQIAPPAVVKPPSVAGAEHKAMKGASFILMYSYIWLRVCVSVSACIRTYDRKPATGWRIHETL